MTFRRVQETAAGTLFSALTHFALLMLLAGWARHATIETPPLPLAVALWTPSEEVRPERKEAPVPRAGVEPVFEPVREIPVPSVDVADPQDEQSLPRPVFEPEAPEEPDVDVAAFGRVTEVPTPELLEPTPLDAVEPDPQLASIAPPSPPVVLAAPPEELEQPELTGSADDLAADPAEALAPFSGLLAAQPSGPGGPDRGKILAERLAASSEAAEARVSRLAGQRDPSVATATTSVPDTSAPGGTTGSTGIAAGVTGPLGDRRILYSEKPPYPDWARRMGLEAEVRFRIWVNPEGIVNRVEVINRSGNVELDELAGGALKRWRFEPLDPGLPRRDEWGVVPMSFTLVRSPE